MTGRVIIWRAAFGVLAALTGVSCSQTAKDAFRPPEATWTELVVHVRTVDEIPVQGAIVRAFVGNHPVIPPHQFGPAPSNSGGRVTFREGFPEAWGWIPVRIEIEPPEGSALSSVVRQDSTHFGPLPVSPHVVVVVLSVAGDEGA